MATGANETVLCLVRIDGLPDPVSALLRGCLADAGLAFIDLCIPRREGLAQRLARIEAACPAERPVLLVGVGLAATLLLTLAATVDPRDDRAVLAIFPFLGVDAPVYQAQRRRPGWADAQLAFFRLGLLDAMCGRMALRPAPRGLETLVDTVSWPDLARCTRTAAFAALVLPLPAQVALVLNSASPWFVSGSSRTYLHVMNRRLRVVVSRPDATNLRARLAVWVRRMQSSLSRP